MPSSVVQLSIGKSGRLAWLVVRLVVPMATVLMLLWHLKMLKLSNLSPGQRLTIQMIQIKQTIHKIQMIAMIQMIQIMQMIQMMQMKQIIQMIRTPSYRSPVAASVGTDFKRE